MTRATMAELRHLRHRIARAADAVISVQPPEGRVRARKVISRSKGRCSGKFPSAKVGRMVEWEAPDELDAFKLLEADHKCLTYAEQPVVIRYRLDGKIHRHYPDIEVRTRQGRELREIKTDRDAKRPEVQRRTALMTRDLPAFGYAYRLVSRSQLRSGPHLGNAKLLVKHGLEGVPPRDREHLRSLFAAQGSITWGELVEGALGPRALRQVSRLLLEGRLELDPLQPINHRTAIRWAQRPQE